MVSHSAVLTSQLEKTEEVYNQAHSQDHVGCTFSMGLFLWRAKGVEVALETCSNVYAEAFDDPGLEHVAVYIFYNADAAAGSQFPQKVDSVAVVIGGAVVERFGPS